MSDPATATVAPTNGAAGKVTPSATAPTKDVSAGPQTPAGAIRGPDGKFTSANPAPAPVDDDPEYDFGGVKMRRSAAQREIERGKAATRLLTEAEKRNKAAEAREKEWNERKAKKDADSLLEELGLSADEEREWLSKRMYGKHIAPSQMSPEQREMADLRAKLAAREAADQKAQATAAEAKKQAIGKAESQKMHKAIIEAAEAGKIPKTRGAIQRIIAKALSFDERGMELPLEQIASIVRDEVAQDMGEYSDATSIEQRKEMLGPDRFKAERAKWLAYFNGLLPSAKPVTQLRTVQPQASDKKTMTPQEFKDFISNRK